MNEEQPINLLRRQLPHRPESPTDQKKWWLFLLVGIMMFILAGCGALAYLSYSSDSLEYDPVTLEPKKPDGFFKKLSYLVFNKDINLEGEKKDRINILLLGMGGLGHDGPFLTDTIMIASMQPSTNEVALISIPRDLGVRIGERGIYKVNHASAFGETEKAGWGGAYATEIIANTLNIPIPYHVRLDFTAFEEIIDEVGGIRVDVPKAFTDYQYPGPKNSYQTISFKQGPQTMDGSTALKYARSRHGNNGEGSDFARARRQQQILVALKDKVLSFGTLTNPLRIKKIMDALEKNMTTNMSFDEILEFVKMGRELDTTTIRNLVLDDGPHGFLVNASSPGGAFILSPKTGSFADITTAITSIFTTTSTLHSTEPEYREAEPPLAPTGTPAVLSHTEADPSIEIQNGTWSAGLAARIEARLKEHKIYSDKVGNVNPDYKPLTTSGIYILDPSAHDTGTEIGTILNIPLLTTLPPEITPLVTHSNIVILLGEDFAE